MWNLRVRILGGDIGKKGNRLVVIALAMMLGSILFVSSSSIISAGDGTRASGTFPASTFNGMQITYDVTGPILDPPIDVSDFTTSRTYSGNLTVGTLSLSGTVYMDWGSDWTKASASVSVGGNEDEWEDEKGDTDSGTIWERPFSLSVPMPSGATSGSFSITMTSLYGNGEVRGLVVSGDFVSPPVVVSYITLSQDENQVEADPTQYFDLRAVVFAEGQGQVPDGTQVSFTLEDWSGDLAGARIDPTSKGTQDSEVTVRFTPPSDSYWDTHDESAGIANRITVTATCDDKEASVNIVIVKETSGGDDYDTDDDGLSDSWEEEYFGDLDEDEDEDYDNDGYTNLEEYQDDSDPTDSDDPGGGGGGMCSSAFILPAIACLAIVIRYKKPEDL